MGFPLTEDYGTIGFWHVKLLAKRGWTKADVEKAMAAGKTRKSTNMATGNTASVYGTKNGYVVVDDVTNNIIQISDRTRPFHPDPRIVWLGGDMADNFNSKLYQRIPASDALDLLKEIAKKDYLMLGVDGFRRKADDTLESNLDWTLDLSLLNQLSNQEKTMLAIEFVKNRMKDDAYFEICAEQNR